MDVISGMDMGGIGVEVRVEDVDFLADDFINEAVNPVNFDADKIHKVIELNVEQQKRGANVEFTKPKMLGIIHEKTENNGFTIET